MDIKVYIQKNQIHHWVNEDLSEVLQFGMRCPEYPNLPTYGMRVDYPITKPIVLAAIKAKLEIIRDQIERDNLIRQQIENMGYLDFTVTIPD
jgi:hypothetical protein